LKLIKYSELKETPWKNGGGITRNIAHAEVSGKLLWRLSMADVSTSGPFSDFSGLMRILTVLKGAGMTLSSAQGVQQVDLLAPVYFDGALKIQADLLSGPLTDLNVMVDPDAFGADVTVLRGAQKQHLKPRAGQILVIHMVSGSARTNKSHCLRAGDTQFFMSQSTWLEMGPDDVGLHICLTPKNQIDAGNPDISFL